MSRTTTGAAYPTINTVGALFPPDLLGRLVNGELDYLKPATAGLDVLAVAECYKVTRSIAFLRARAHHEATPDDLIATCASTFMLGSSGEVPFPRNAKVPQ